jgi:hypothetical protein
MKISGGFARETSGPRAAAAAGRAADEGPRRRRIRPAYALAVMWVVIGLVLYTFEMLKLVGVFG